MKPELAALPEHVIRHIEHLERIRRDFIANVSHELRTPLTVIHGYLEAMLDQAHDATQPWRNIFLQMHQQTLRMENLVENLLLLARLENETETQCSEETVDIARMLSSICDEARTLSNQQHNIQLHVDPAIKLFGFSDELRSLFSNIIFNAVKYTPAGGQISVDWFLQDNVAHCRVRDTGIGIATEHVPRLTERFYRVDPARSRASGGTGLGLAIARHVLLRHCADLKIDSTPGEGSIFCCLFKGKRVVTST